MPLGTVVNSPEVHRSREPEFLPARCSAGRPRSQLDEQPSGKEVTVFAVRNPPFKNPSGRTHRQLFDNACRALDSRGLESEHRVVALAKFSESVPARDLINLVVWSIRLRREQQDWSDSHRRSCSRTRQIVLEGCPRSQHSSTWSARQHRPLRCELR
jgi:hypothetical protein